MRIRSIAASLATTALLGGAIVVPTTAALAESSPAQKALGNRSLAKVLTSDGNRFDRNWGDYDIVTEAALAVIKAKPNSPVSVLTKGDGPGYRVHPERLVVPQARQGPHRHEIHDREAGLQRAGRAWGSTPSRPCFSTTSCPVPRSTPRPLSEPTGSS